MILLLKRIIPIFILFIISRSELSQTNFNQVVGKLLPGNSFTIARQRYSEC